MIFHIKTFSSELVCKSYAHFYKFSRDFANKVEIHICKFSQQLDHISHGKLIFFYFFDIFIIFFYFLKLKRRSRGVVEFENEASNPFSRGWPDQPVLKGPSNSTPPPLDRLFNFRKNKRKKWKCQKK